jgi:hypothetical protein
MAGPAMSAGEVMLLVASVLLLLAAHGARAVRWGFLFPKKQARSDRTGLLIGLGIGYAINALIPFRVGEIVRGIVASRLRQSRLAEVMATIVAERIADLFILSLFIAATWRSAPDPAFAFGTAALFATAAASIGAGAIVILRSPASRRLLWRLAGIFNPRIRVGVADFAWSTAETVAGGTLLRWRFTVATIVMWGLYAAAYFSFSYATGVGFARVLQAVLQHPLASLTVGLGPAAEAAGGFQLYLFVLAPVLLILLLSPLTRSRPVLRAALPLLSIGKSGRCSPPARSERFTGAANYEDFLDALFSDARRAVSGFGMGAVDDCVVHRFYQGGSDALAALVETEGQFVIRKFAMGAAAAKLEVQADWLRRHSAPSLPLVEVIGGRKSIGAYSYDMPLVDGASDFQDSIHSSPTDKNRDLLLRILDRIDALHGETAMGAAPDALVDRYVEEKIVRNAEAIGAFARHMVDSHDYSINGEDFDFGEWRCFSDRAWLASQLRRREASTIHGDLTVENVIVAPSQPYGLYLIDPNPENIFESPLIDWAKMMQSLHLGYEALNRSIACVQTGSALRLPIARSQAYAELHDVLEKEIEARFREDAVREVYFHELVNYLRLTTYKIRQSPQRGLAFFGCTSLLLRRYRERFA